MAALMASSSAFVGAKVTARATTKAVRAQTVIMANSSGPKRVSSPARGSKFSSLFVSRYTLGLVARAPDGGYRAHPRRSVLRGPLARSVCKSRRAANFGRSRRGAGVFAADLRITQRERRYCISRSGGFAYLPIQTRTCDHFG